MDPFRLREQEEGATAAIQIEDTDDAIKNDSRN
jgi:hypothetical protein